MDGTTAIEIAHLLAGGLVLLSFLMLYQDRLSALISLFAAHALLLAACVAWQAHIQGAPQLYITAAIALALKAGLIPAVLRRLIVRLDIHRQIEPVIGSGLTMLAGMGLVTLAIVVTLKTSGQAGALAQMDMGLALGVFLLGFLTMIVRRNAVAQILGFMSLENGVVLAAVGAQGMPFVVEVSVAFSVLVAFLVLGFFLFHIRERFASVDAWTVDKARGESIPSTALRRDRHMMHTRSRGERGAAR